jgi:hypothetical protein
MLVHFMLNFIVGWSSILAAFLTGAAIGLFFHKPQFMGGYDSFRRRILRLGHIALAALGMMNVVFSLCPIPVAGSTLGIIASTAFIVGNLSMPLVCFLSAWREPFRHLFFIPVISLVLAVVCVLAGAMS